MLFFRRRGEPRVSGTLLAWLRRTGDIVRRVNERNMGECLGEVANQTLSASVVFLREQADVVAQADQPLKQALRVRAASDQEIGVGEPEATGKEGPPAGRQPGLGRDSVVSEHAPAVQELSLEGLDSAMDARVVGWQEADLRDQQRARIQQVAVVLRANEPRSVLNARRQTSSWISARIPRQRSTGPSRPNASTALMPRSNATHAITFE